MLLVLNLNIACVCSDIRWFFFFLLPVSEKIYRKEAFSCLSIPQISYNQIWLHFCFVIANDTSKSLSILIFHFFILAVFLKLPEIVTMCFLVLCFPPTPPKKKLIISIIFGKSSRTSGLVSSEVKVSQLCLTLCNPVDCIVHGILQARILEWVAIPFSWGSSPPRNWTGISCIAGGCYQLSYWRCPMLH